MSGIQTRSCEDTNSCDTTFYRPSLSKSCGDEQSIYDDPTNSTNTTSNNSTAPITDSPGVLFGLSWTWLILIFVAIAGVGGFFIVKGVGLFGQSHLESAKYEHIKKLNDYLLICLEKHIPDEQIFANLSKSGWPEKMVYEKLRDMKIKMKTLHINFNN